MDRTEQAALFDRGGDPAPLNIYPNTVRYQGYRCKNCGRKLWFARTVRNGKMHPFVDNPRDHIVRTGEDGTVYVNRRISHFTDCPGANKFRRRGAQ